MSLDRRPRHFVMPTATRRGLSAPGVYLRFRLRLVRHAIARIENQLEGEFATEHSAPLLDELKALIAEQAELMSRLAGNG